MTRNEAESDQEASVRLGARIAALAARREISPLSLITAAWACLLCRYSREQTLTLAVVDASRGGRHSHAAAPQRTGRARCSVDAAQTFASLARSLNIELSEASESDDDVPLAALSWSDDGRAAALCSAARELTLAADCAHGKLSLRIVDHTNTYSEAFVTRLGHHLSFLLEGMLERPDDRLDQIPFLPESERQAVLGMLNPADAVGEGGHETLVQLFETQAASTPDIVALEYGELELTYRELNERADRLRSRLMAEHERQFQTPFPPETRVALLLGRGPLQIVASLAVLKAGGAYVPLDPAYPAERLSFMLHDSGAVLILTEASLATRLASSGASELSIVCPSAARLLTIDGENSELPVSPARPAPAVLAHQLAYVIYTSGSTGKPRGVLIEHAGVAVLARFVIDRFSLGPGARLLQLASFSFDASVFEWVGALGSGATLVLVSDDELPPREDVADLLERKNIHVALIVPSVLRNMKKRSLPRFRALLVGAEPCTPDIARDWAPGRTLFNVYGPTETTVLSTLGVIGIDGPLHIGRAIAGRKLLVLNGWFEQLPIGAVGELCITGAGLARGYLNRPAGTAQSFVCVPESLKQTPDDGARFYRSGDLVRLLEDGNLEYVGRVDNQVKIRGFRVELGEVEAHLHTYPGIVESAVVYQTDPAWASGRLVAFYASSDRVDDAELAARLEHHLRTQLPSHMVPQHYQRFERLPVNANGKIDRTRLRQRVQRQGASSGSAAYEQPLTKNERILRDVWEEVLGLRGIGIDTNFFALGGDSISAIAMVRRAEERGLAIRGVQVVEHPRISALARMAVPLEGPGESRRGLPLGECFELTPIQHWFFERTLPAPERFSQFQVIRCRDIDATRLERALTRLLGMHDAFCLCFPVIDGRRKAKYLAAPVRPTPFHASLAGEIDPERKLRELYAQWQSGFDFETGQTVAFGVVRGHPDGVVRLFLALHHLIVDGVSWRILLEDWKRLYFHDSAVQPGGPLYWWRRALGEYGSASETQKHLPYWALAQQAASQFRLPVRTCVADAVATGSIQLRVSRAMRELADDDLSRLAPLRRHRMEVFLAAFVAVLSEWSGSKQVAFQLEGHGREECVGIDPGRSVGWYTALFPVRMELPDENDPISLFRAVQTQYQSIPDRGLSFGVLRYLHPDPAVRGALRGPDGSVLFNYLGSFNNPAGNAFEDWVLHDEDAAQDVSGPENPSHVLFEVNCSCVDERFVCQVGYSPNHFHEREVRAFLERFFERVRAMTRALAEQAEPWSACGAEGYGRISKTFPLTPLQEGMLFYDRAGSSRDNYFVQAVWRYDSVPDADRMQRAFAEVCEETEPLRTFFRWEESSRPVQCVVHGAEIDLRWTDLSALCEAEQDRAIAQMLRDDRATPFNLNIPGQMRLHWIARGGFCDLLWSHHHIILDGWSLPLILSRAHKLYADASLARTASSRPARIGFDDFVRHQRAADPGPAARYFAEQLASGDFTGEVPVTRTAGELDPLKAVDDPGETELFLGVETLAGLLELARNEGITPATLVLFAFGVVLSAYNQGGDVVFGTTISGRNHDLPGLEALVGLTINTLPVFFRPTRSASIRSALQALQVQIAKLNEHGLYPLRAIVDPSSGAQVRFSAVVVFENYPRQNRVEEGGLRARLLREIEKTGYPLSVVCRLQDEGLQFKLMYDREVFAPEAMQRMARHLCNALQRSAASPGAPYSQLTILEPDERRALITALAGPKASGTSERIEHRFRVQVAKTPEYPALVSEHATLSYADVDRLSDRVRDLILSLNLGRSMQRLPVEALVAVVAERSFEFVCGILGVLKAGCAYLPLDPGAPAERTNAILKDANVRCVLTFRRDIAGLQPSCDVLPPASLQDEPGDSVTSTPPDETTGGSVSPLAYVMYTSGSAGKPRGVLVNHAGVLRLVSSPNYATLEPGVRILQTGALGFDASTFEIWGALLNGGTLYFVPWHSILDPRELGAALRKERIDLLWLTTGLFHRLVNEDPSIFASLKQLIVGGEVLHAGSAEKLRKATPGLVLTNFYGPTENTTFSTFYHVPYDVPASVPIGRVVSGTFALVLDPWLEPVPIGVVGELYVGGEGVARGYLNDPVETGRKFITVPSRLIESGVPPGARLYRTGDLVRIEEDGNLGFVGRSDEQLKIRGHRVEPAEIEWALNQHARIPESAVVFRKDVGGLDGGLVAYCVCSGDSPAVQALADELDRHVRALLLAAMIPEGYVFVEHLPLTPNGKVDRASLKRRPLDPARLIRPGEAHARDGNREATNERERVLRDVWQDILGRRRISLRQNFYALGGDSLSAIRVTSTLRRRGYRLSVQDVLNFPTIERCSARLRAIEGAPELCAREGGASSAEAGGGVATASPLLRAEAAALEAYPLGPAQYRFFGRGLPNPNHFVTPFLAKLARRLDAHVLPSRLKAVLHGQDAHNVCFRPDVRTGGGRQVYKAWKPSDYFEHVVLSGDDRECQRRQVTELASALCRSFDIEKGPLFRVVLFENFESPEGQLLLIVFHHLISDGLSLNVFLERFRQASLSAAENVDAPEPDERRTSYLSWCLEVDRYAQTADLRAQREYWERVTRSSDTEGSVRRPPHARMRTLTACAPCADPVADLSRASARLGATPFVLLLSVFLRSLDRAAFSFETIHIQTSQREQTLERGPWDMDRIMGYFSAALPFRSPPLGELRGEHGFDDVVRIVADQLRETRARGLDYLVLQYVLPALDPGNQPFRDSSSILFHYLSEDPLRREDDFYDAVDLTVGPASDPANPSNYLLNFTVVLSGSGIELTAYYSPDDYTERRVRNLLDVFRSALGSLVLSEPTPERLIVS